MDTAVTVAVILAMTALGAFLVHRLNDRHADRIAQRQYSRPLPGHRGAPGSAQPRPVTAAAPAAHDRRDHGDGDRVPLRPRHRSVKHAKDQRR